MSVKYEPSETELFFGLPLRQASQSGNALKLDTTIAGKHFHHLLIHSQVYHVAMLPYIMLSYCSSVHSHCHAPQQFHPR